MEEKKKIEVSLFDAAQYLKTDEDIQAYLEEAAAENDPQSFLQALNTVARATGMAKLARDVGVARESLYQSLSEKGNPSFRTLWKVVDAFGYTLSVRRKTAAQ